MFFIGKSERAFLLGAAALLAAGTLHAAGPKQPPPTVGVEKSTTVKQSEPRRYIARTLPYELVEITARVSGTMTKDPKWREGGDVRKGQLLYTIEDTVYKANVLSAEASILSAKAAIEQIKAELEFAQNEYNREKMLYDKKASSDSKLQDKLRALNTCKARLAAAQASLKSAEAALLLARNDLEYTRIVSPVTGRIGKNVYSSGNYITPAKGALATIVQYDPIKLRFAISEADYLHYKKNKSLPNLTMEIFGADGQQVTGKAKLDFVDNLADTDTGTVMVQFLVSNPDGKLTPDGYATVKISETFAEPLVAVSTSALVIGNNEFFVYVVAGDKTVEQRKVTPGAVVGDKIVILEGLKEGETVIVQGTHKVQKLFKAAAGNKEKSEPVKVEISNK